MDKNKKAAEQQQVNAEKMYPGAATDYADNEKVTPKMVRKDVKELNNNPRNNKLDE